MSFWFYFGPKRCNVAPKVLKWILKLFPLYAAVKQTNRIRRNCWEKKKLSSHDDASSESLIFAIRLEICPPRKVHKYISTRQISFVPFKKLKMGPSFSPRETNLKKANSGFHRYFFMGKTFRRTDWTVNNIPSENLSKVPATLLRVPVRNLAKTCIARDTTRSNFWRFAFNNFLLTRSNSWNNACGI